MSAQDQPMTEQERILSEQLIKVFLMTKPGRKIEAAIEAFGKALSPDEQLFVSREWRNIQAYLETPQGKENARLTVQLWKDAMQ